MTIKHGKTQDYLAVGAFKTQIREDATYQVSGTATDESPATWLVTAPIGRLGAIAIGTGGAIATGSVVVDVERIRPGASVVSLLSSTITLDSSSVTDGSLVDYSAQIDPAKDLLPGDRIRLTRTPTAPTNTSTLFVLQGAVNGDN